MVYDTERSMQSLAMYLLSHRYSSVSGLSEVLGLVERPWSTEMRAMVVPRSKVGSSPANVRFNSAVVWL